MNRPGLVAAVVLVAAVLASGCMAKETDPPLAPTKSPTPGTTSSGMPGEPGPWLERCESAQAEQNASIVGQDGPPRDGFPVVDGRACNVYRNGTESLVVPIMPSAPPVWVLAIANGTGIDWLYVDEQAWEVVLVPQGVGPPVAVLSLEDPPLLPAGERAVTDFKAAWQNKTLHVVLSIRVAYAGQPSLSETQVVHAWWDGASHFERLPPLGDPPAVRHFGPLVADETGAMLVAIDLWGSDVFLGTRHTNTLIWTTRAGAFDEPVEVEGMWTMGAAMANGTAHLCGIAGGDVFHASSPEFAFEHVVDTGAPFLANCLAAATPQPHVLTWVYPTSGEDGGGGGGSGDSKPYQAVSWESGEWVPRPVPRTPRNYAEFGSSLGGPFLVDDAAEGENWVELWAPVDGNWTKRWGHDGPRIHQISGLSSPAFYASAIKDPRWDYGSWAAVLVESGQ